MSRNVRKGVLRLGGGTIIMKTYFHKIFALMLEMEKQIFGSHIYGSNDMPINMNRQNFFIF